MAALILRSAAGASRRMFQEATSPTRASFEMPSVRLLRITGVAAAVTRDGAASGHLQRREPADTAAFSAARRAHRYRRGDVAVSFPARRGPGSRRALAGGDAGRR